MKQARFHAVARDVIRSFPNEVRFKLGESITDLQHGHLLSLPLSRAMPSIAPGACELRFRDRSGIYRVFYYLKVEDEVLVFHAFQKKTQKTPQNEIETAKKRLREML